MDYFKVVDAQFKNVENNQKSKDHELNEDFARYD